MINKYDDIINYSHYEPKRHKRMPILERASQFAPFAALTGYEEKIKEVSKEKYDKKEILEDKINEIDLKLVRLKSIIKEKPLITITYFKEGTYLSYTGNLKQIDDINRVLVFTNKKKIPLEDVMEISI